jgi:3-dehydroquinate dehydratase-2
MAKSRRREQTLPIYVLNGPNLNLLGRREPEIYGTQTLADIEKAMTQRAGSFGWTVDFRQSNSEGTLVDWLHEAREKAAGVVLNAGAYSHTSIALLDACRALGKPLVEVHLSNPYAREHFRRHSYISEAANGVICGFGGAGYALAVDALSELLRAQAR